MMSIGLGRGFGHACPPNSDCDLSWTTDGPYVTSCTHPFDPDGAKHFSYWHDTGVVVIWYLVWYLGIIFC